MRRMSVFGSAAVGKDRPDSDVDLLVEFIPGEAPSGFALVDMQGELSAAFNGRKIDLAFPSVLRNPFRRTYSPNQIVALNVGRARALRGWTQEQAAEALTRELSGTEL